MDWAGDLYRNMIKKIMAFGENQTEIDIPAPLLTRQRNITL